MLIAFVVTLVILLILAGVTIATLFGEHGIIKMAHKAAENTEKELQNLMNELSNTLGNNINDNIESGGDDTPSDPEDEYNKAEVDQKVDETSTINGSKPSEANPYIPKGFKPINTDTSKWDDPSGPQVNKGLVISDGNSEFVFIPVANINDMVMCQEHGASKTLDKETLQCPECKENTKLAGKLYSKSGDNFDANLTGQTYTKNSSGLREPDNLTGSYAGMHDASDNVTRLKKETWTEDLYQKSFDNMAKSVAKYKGFYVGRYETSLNGNNTQSKSGQTPMSGINWWEHYENSKMYSKSNINLGVTSEMIWGCQWDAIMRFILTTEDSSHVNSNTNVGHSEFTTVPYKTGGTNYNEVYTGSVKYNDVAVNIYDLEGNWYEWVQTASEVGSRVIRGGSYWLKYKPTASSAGTPVGNTSCGSRLTIYL